MKNAVELKNANVKSYSYIIKRIEASIETAIQNNRNSLKFTSTTSERVYDLIIEEVIRNDYLITFSKYDKERGYMELHFSW